MGAPIDVAWGGGPTLFNSLDEIGYLMPIDPTSKPEHYAIIYELGKIPDRIAGAET
jgi:ABC-type Fe3+ transport system substrate-binding protein